MNIFVRAWGPAFVKLEKSLSKGTKMIVYHFNFATFPSFSQADFLSPNLVMFLSVWFYFKNQNLTLNVPSSRWLIAENYDIVAVFSVVVRVELLADHLLS